MEKSLASRYLTSVSLPEGATVSRSGEAEELSLTRDQVTIVVTVPRQVREWFVQATDASSGLSVRDWCDYDGYDQSTVEERERSMTTDVAAFIDRIVHRDLRIVAVSRFLRNPRISLEWRVGEDWKQAIPFLPGDF